MIFGTATFFINRKYGEFRKNGTMRRFPGPYRVPSDFFTTVKKIRANRRNWKAKVLQSRAGPEIVNEGAVLGSPVIPYVLGSGTCPEAGDAVYRKFFGRFFFKITKKCSARNGHEMVAFTPDR
jgi:hypothetical protein